MKWVSMSVTACGGATCGPLAYQWKLNGSNLTAATASSYHIGLANQTADGFFTVVVSNSAGTITSAPWQIGVTSPGRLVGWGGIIAFLDTNNVIYWRAYLQQVEVGNDTDVGILNADLPASVGYLPVVSSNLSNYLPPYNTAIVQGIGMNQDMKLFSQPMTFGDPVFLYWDSTTSAPFGLTTNWNVATRGGDSSDPEMFLIGNQLVLVSHNFIGGTNGRGPNYAHQTDAINQQMHYLSTNNAVVTDYQLTPHSLTNWPAIH